MQQNQQHDTTGQENQGELLGVVAKQAMHQVGQMTDTAREQGFSWLADQKIQASGTLETAAKALTEIGRRLEQDGQGPIGQSLSMAGEKIDQFSRTLKEREVNELYAEVEDFARRQPVYFFGGALVLGVLAARFLKSAAQAAGTDSEPVSTPGSGGTNVLAGRFPQQNRTAPKPAGTQTPSGTMGRSSSAETSPSSGESDGWWREIPTGSDS